MALSRTTRILILLVVDILFFIVEITVGKPLFGGCATSFVDSLHLSRLPHRVVGTCCRQLSYVEVSPVKLFTTIASESCSSDVLSLSIALYAIKVRLPCVSLCLLELTVSSAQFQAPQQRTTLIWME